MGIIELASSIILLLVGICMIAARAFVVCVMEGD